MTCPPWTGAGDRSGFRRALMKKAGAMMTQEQEREMRSELKALRQQVAELSDEVAELSEEVEDAEQTVEQIADIHQTLLPTQLPRIAGLEAAVSHLAPNRAGGDYYDLIPLGRGDGGEPDPAGSWLIIVADASGHGPAAATIMAMLQAIVHAYTPETRAPGQVLEHMNQQMARKKIEGSFTTALAAILDPVAGTFAYASAGHHAPLLRYPDGRVVELSCEEGGPPLAVDPDAAIGGRTHALQPGETVLLYTDGVIEQANPQGQRFNLAGLTDALAQAAGPPRLVLDHVGEAARRHRAGSKIEDDRTLLALQRQG